MSETLRKKWTDIWSEVFSPTIFMLDVIDSFKYRKMQAWLALLAALAIFSLISWFFFVDISSVKWRSDRIVLLALFYLPLLVTLLFWFRASSIYDFTIGGATAEKQFFTKKQARASLIFKASIISFGFYYCYCWYRMWQITY